MMKSQTFAVAVVLLFCLASVFAQNKSVSSDATRGVKLAENDPHTSHGKRIVVAIGIDHYDYWPILRTAVNDATEFSRLLTSEFGFVELRPPLTENEATRDAIISLVEDQLPTTVEDEDDLVLFFSGHGTTLESKVGQVTNRVGYIVPVAAHATGPQERPSEYIDIDELLRSISRLRARHILVILDSCHSGLALGTGVAIARGDTKFQAAMERKVSRKVIASAQEDQTADDGGPVSGHSLFTGSLIEGLRSGKADWDGAGFVTSSELGLYTQRQVSKIASDRQTPVFGSFYLDDSGELVLPLKGDFQSLVSQANAALASGEFKKFDSLTAKAAELRPEAPESIYLQYRSDLLNLNILDAQKRIEALQGLDREGKLVPGVIPLSAADIETILAALQLWGPILAIPPGHFPIEPNLVYVQTGGVSNPIHVEPIGDTDGYPVKQGELFKFWFTNTLPTIVHVYGILIDSDGRITKLQLFFDVTSSSGLSPNQKHDTVTLRAPSRIDEIHLVASSKDLREWLDVYPSGKIGGFADMPPPLVQSISHTVLRINKAN